MERKLIDPESTNDLEEILAFDKEVMIYYWWLCRPQVKIALNCLTKLERERVLVSPGYRMRDRQNSYRNCKKISFL